MSHEAEYWQAVTERARASLELQVSHQLPKDVDARIAQLQSWGLYERAKNVLAARVKVHGPQT